MFNKLPNDPQLQTLTQEQRNFIIYSIQQDNKEAEALANNSYITGDYVDNNFDTQTPDEDWEIVPEGVDLEDIGRQLDEKTADKSFKDKIRAKIEDKLAEKEAEAQYADDKVSQNIVKARELAKQREAEIAQSVNNDDEYTPL